MAKPLVKVMGIYNLGVRPELIDDALMIKYGDVKLSPEQEEVARQSVINEMSQVVLIDLSVKNAPEDFDPASIGQEGNTEKPYESIYLTENGKHAISRKRPHEDRDVRVAFYLHGYLPGHDLDTPWGKFALPVVEPLDPGFLMIHPYRPRIAVAEALTDYVNEFRNRPQIWEGKGVLIRAAAYVLDCVFLYLISSASGFIIGVLLGIYVFISGQEFTMNEELISRLKIPFGLFMQLFYFGIFEWAYGATFGKMILRLRVVKEDGTPCGFWAILLRSIFRYLDGLVFAIPAILSMTRHKNQRIGDRIANTFVVSSRDPGIIKKQPAYMLVFAILGYLFIHTCLFLLLFILILD